MIIRFVLSLLGIPRGRAARDTKRMSEAIADRVITRTAASIGDELSRASAEKMQEVAKKRQNGA